MQQTHRHTHRQLAAAECGCLRVGGHGRARAGAEGSSKDQCQQLSKKYGRVFVGASILALPWDLFKVAKRASDANFIYDSIMCILIYALWARTPQSMPHTPAHTHTRTLTLTTTSSQLLLLLLLLLPEASERRYLHNNNKKE